MKLLKRVLENTFRASFQVCKLSLGIPRNDCNEGRKQSPIFCGQPHALSPNEGRQIFSTKYGRSYRRYGWVKSIQKFRRVFGFLLNHVSRSYPGRNGFLLYVWILAAQTNTFPFGECSICVSGNGQISFLRSRHCTDLHKRFHD